MGFLFYWTNRNKRRHVDEQEEDEEASRARLARPRAHREAPQALWRARQRRRAAPPQDQLRQVPPRLLRKGWHEELPRARERVDAVLPGRQPGPPLDARFGADAQEVREERQEGPRHRRLQGGILQGFGEGRAAEAAGDREGALLQPAGRGEDQGRRRRMRTHRNVRSKSSSSAICHRSFPTTTTLHRATVSQ